VRSALAQLNLCSTNELFLMVLLYELDEPFGPASQAERKRAKRLATRLRRDGKTFGELFPAQYRAGDQGDRITNLAVAMSVAADEIDRLLRYTGDRRINQKVYRIVWISEAVKRWTGRYHDTEVATLISHVLPGKTNKRQMERWRKLDREIRRSTVSAETNSGTAPTA
jgi:hypothetical protein